MSTTLRDALFEAHVRHELARLRGEQIPARVASFVAELFEWMQRVRLCDVSNSEQISGIIQRCAIELRVSGGIMELVGEMGQLVLASPTSDDTRLGQVLDDGAYERFAEKIAQLPGVWRELSERVVHSEAGEVIQEELITRALDDLLRAAPHRLRRFTLRLEVQLARALAARLRRASREHGEAIAVLGPELIRSLADEVWSSVSSLPLRQLFALIDKQDLEDFIVLGHEFWLHYRQTPYFHRLMEEMVAHFFTKYGEQSLAELVDDMGVSQQLLAHELAVLLTPILSRALDSGFAEQQLRAQLRTFYESPACASLLAEL